MMNREQDEAAQLLDEIAQRWFSARRTFTEQEALQPVWDAGYEIPIQSDARFVLVHEGNGKHPSHWRLTQHTVANTRLLHELLAGTWDGRDMEEKLAALESEDQRHYIFFPLDARFIVTKQGVLEPAEQERNVKLPRGMKAALDALSIRLLTSWRESGSEPWTVRTIIEVLRRLEWRDAEMPNAWLYVRAWLLSWSQVVRVGQDYWIPGDQVPQEVQRTRLHVLPLQLPDLSDPQHTQHAAAVTTLPSKRAHSTGQLTVVPQADESQVMLRDEVRTDRASWTTRLRTVHLLEGFLHVPSLVRSVYPAPVPGEAQKTVLRGMWHEDGTRFWLWLDRANNRLSGPALAEHLQWLEAGTLLHIEWAPDIIVMQVRGIDEAVRDEESRLVDLQALSVLRGGLGENYRRSLQTILLAAPNGLTLAEIIVAMRERQQHQVHRGTIHALLYHGGFLHKEQRWFAAPNTATGARQLRTALVETLIPEEQDDLVQPVSHTEHLRQRVKAIHARLAEITSILSQSP